MTHKALLTILLALVLGCGEVVDSGSSGLIAPFQSGDLSGTWTGTWVGDVGTNGGGAIAFTLIEEIDTLSGAVKITGTTIFTGFGSVSGPCFTTGSFEGGRDGNTITNALILTASPVAVIGTLEALGNRMMGSYEVSMPSTSACFGFTGTIDVSRP